MCVFPFLSLVVVTEAGFRRIKPLWGAVSTIGIVFPRSCSVLHSESQLIQKGTSDNSELKDMSNPTCDDVFVAQTNHPVNAFDSQQESNSMKILEGETLPNPSLRTKHTPQVTQRRHVF